MRSERQLLTRRQWLAVAGSVGCAMLAGCVGTGDTVRVFSAGSLSTVLDERVRHAFQSDADSNCQTEFYGSNAIVRMVLDGKKHPDCVVSADVKLVRDRLYPDHASWDAVFATNELGLAYNLETELGRQLETRRPWYEVLRTADDGAVAISDPNLDPLGYRAMHLFELAERTYDINGFVEAMANTVYQEPSEPRLLAGVETGNRAVAVAYRNMAVAHDLPFYELPDELNFSSPAYADRYAEATYTTDDGYTTHGTPIRYTATVLDDAAAPDGGRDFVRFLTQHPDLLREQGLAVPAALPTYNGAVPEVVR